MAGSEWDESLFGCFNNFGICALSYFLPCYVNGKNAEAIEKGFFLNCCGMLIPIVNIVLRVQLRKEIRHRQNIDGTRCNDILAIFFCSCCTIIQEANEVKHMFGEDNMQMARS